MKKQRKQKRKMSNETKFIILNIIVIGILIFKIKTEGIGFISTIGYFK